MYKTVVDKITLGVSPLREKKLPENSISHFDETVNTLEKDSSERKTLFGECKRKFTLTGISGLKALKLNLDYRPMTDTEERLDFFIDIRCIRNGVQVDRQVVKYTHTVMIKANGKNIMQFVLSNKKLLKNTAVEENDVLIISMKQTRKPKKTIYFANMYITKE